MHKKMEKLNFNTGIKFGFLGLGMAGCSIAYRCATVRTDNLNYSNPYKAILITTNEIDIRKHEGKLNIRKIFLNGYEKGTGRNINVGEEAFVKHSSEIFSQVKTYFQDREFVWIVAGLGGGTGTGSVLQAIMMMLQSGFKGRLGLILTLPTDDEGLVVLDNALDRLQKIFKAVNGLGSILFVDNQKFYNDCLKTNPNASSGDYLEYSNKFIADTLHGINVATASFDPIAGFHFDSSEFLNAIKTPGVISISRNDLSHNEPNTLKEATYMPEIIRGSFEHSVLTDRYNLATAKNVAVSMVAPSSKAHQIFSMDSVDRIRKLVKELAPNPKNSVVAPYEDTVGSEVVIYSVFAGLTPPKRVIELRDFARNARKQNNHEYDPI